jgi:hypothetical protein
MFEFLKDATLVNETETDKIYKNDDGKFFRINKKLEGAKVIKESEDRMMLGVGDSICMMSKSPVESTLVGDYVKLGKGATEEDLENAREQAIEKLCEAIRKVAKETPELVFIEKSYPEDDIVPEELRGGKTVGCKAEIIAPRSR